MAVPDPPMLLGVIDPQVNPAGMVSVSETVPVNPLIAVIVMVEVRDVPTIPMGGEVAAIVKSVTAKVTVAE